MKLKTNLLLILGGFAATALISCGPSGEKKDDKAAGGSTAAALTRPGIDRHSA